LTATQSRAHYVNHPLEHNPVIRPAKYNLLMFLLDDDPVSSSIAHDLVIRPLEQHHHPYPKIPPIPSYGGLPRGYKFSQSQRWHVG
jgi:hypothetical protein